MFKVSLQRRWNFKCWINRLFRRLSKLLVTDFLRGNLPVSSQMANNTESVLMSWRLHDIAHFVTRETNKIRPCHIYGIWKFSYATQATYKYIWIGIDLMVIGPVLINIIYTYIYTCIYHVTYITFWWILSVSTLSNSRNTNCLHCFYDSPTYRRQVINPCHPWRL